MSEIGKQVQEVDVKNSFSADKVLNTLCKHIVTSRSYSVLGTMKDGTLTPFGVQQDADFRWPVVEIPELVPLLDQFDCIMARGNGWSFEVICLNNRVSDRSAPMRVSLEKLRQIGRGCFKYANSINGEQLPVRFQVWELIDAADPNNNRSEELCERVSLKNKTGISYWSLNTSTLGVRTNERFNGFFAGRRNAEHALVSALAGEMPTPIKEVQIGTPY